LAACRAVICAALWFDPADENCPQEFRDAARHEMRKWARDNRGLMSAESYDHFEAVKKKPALLDDDEMLRTLLLDFIADFANWDNSTRREYLETSRALTEAAHVAAGGEPGTRPLVIDPFAGGGAIPLEALRVGADAFASDLNPVAVLLNKVVLEYIPRYGQRLADEVRKWGTWVKEQAEKELAEFYPKDIDGATPITYLWARTIICEGPGCGSEVPIMRSLWLAKGGRRPTALRIVPNRKDRRIDFEIVQNAKSSDKNEGTVKRGSVTCPLCGYTTPVASVRRQLNQQQGGADSARLFCVVTTNQNQLGRSFRLPTDRDHVAILNAKKELKHQKEIHNNALNIVPDEILPLMSGVFNAPISGHNTWGSLFTSRQALSLVTLIRLIKDVGKQLEKKDESKEFAVAVQTLLALAVGKQADLGNALCGWEPVAQCPRHLFGRQAIGMVWDFAEGVVTGESSGAWGVQIDRTEHVLDSIGSNWLVGTANQGSATSHPLADDSVSAFITDPPYYNAIPYADLSDFFYVWLRRALKDVYPDLLSSSLAPKDEEITEMAGWDPVRYPHKDKAFFEREMGKAMAEGRRVLQPSGIGVVVFAHKSTAGWEAQLQAMVDAGWTMTGSWAIDTEMGTRLRAQNSAALASSVHLICRPRENEDGSVRADDIGDWRDVLRELPIRIHEWMPRLAKEGVVGADAIFACLGPALEIFSRYSCVEKASGEQVTLREYLEYVWAAVAKEALTLIFAGETDADVTGFEEDARLTAMWLWTLFAGAKPEDDKQGADGDAEGDSDDEESSGKSAKPIGFTLEYDAARKIAQGLGAHLEELTQLVEVKGDKARLLPVAERTKHLFGKDEAEAPRRGGRKKDKQSKLFDTLDDVEAGSGGWGDKSAPQLGDTVLDRVHQAMILFAAGRGDAMRRFLVDDGVGNDERFWRLANALSALYPPGVDEKRWVDGVLARKKGLGF
jgi:adenine-specific DNA methylase